jgi:hypothetical protein
MSDFKTKTRPCQIVTASNEKNAIFLAINHTLISFEKDTYKGNKKIPTRLTLIRAVAPGWNSAPYKKNQKTARPQKLTEFVGGPIPALRFYSFEKVSNNSEKGPRCNDITFELQAGNALNYWLDEKRLGEIRDILPAGLLQIPAFTVCEVEVAPTNNEAVAKGYGCTIKKITPCDFTLHSCIPDIEAFPPSFVDASTGLLKHQQAQTNLGTSLVVDEPSFFIHVADKAYIHEDADQPAFVTLVNSGVDPVDIPLPTLMQYTNSTKKTQACSLLEMAIAMGALRLLVIHNNYWKGANTSALRGIPIINTEILLQSIVPTREQICFPTPNSIAVEDITYNIQIHVDSVRSSVFFRSRKSTSTRIDRSPPPSPTDPRRSHPTSCSHASRWSSSAPTSSASPFSLHPATRSRATGWDTLTPRRARSRRRWASTSASSHPQMKRMRRRTSRRAADIETRDGGPGLEGATQRYRFLLRPMIPRPTPCKEIQTRAMKCQNGHPHHDAGLKCASEPHIFPSPCAECNDAH